MSKKVRRLISRLTVLTSPRAIHASCSVRRYTTRAKSILCVTILTGDLTSRFALRMADSFCSRKSCVTVGTPL